jgi:tRNA (adenine57-N1/adenine58-N1)-methyltransferase
MRLVEPGDLVLLLGGDRKPFFLRAHDGGELQTHHGVVPHALILGQPWGTEVHSHLGYTFLVLPPTLHDILLYLRRQSQIIFPKDLGYILLRLSAGPGKTILEAGTGSGGLTTALAWMVGREGRVISYDRRDALFLDLPDPDLYLSQARAALRNGAPLGAILPTANQVSDLIEALNQSGFGFIEVCEIMLRFYKTVPARLRPLDRMVAHTGYLVFARALLPGSTPAALEGDEPPAPEELDNGESRG